MAALASVGAVDASKLLVASYKSGTSTNGVLQSLEFSAGSPSFQVISENAECGPSPSWLDIHGDVVTCVDEGTPGGMTLLRANSDGSHQKL